MSRHLVKASTQYLINSGGFSAILPITLSCWFRPTDIQANAQTLVEINQGGTIGFQIFNDGTNGIGELATDGTHTGDVITGSTLTAGVWYNVVGTFISDSSRFAYLNGTPTAQDTATVTHPTGSMNIVVGNGQSFGLPLNGDIAEVGIWNVQLLSVEINQLAAGVSPLLVHPSALVDYYPLFGNYSPENDLMVNNAPLTLTNGPTSASHVNQYYPWSQG